MGQVVRNMGYSSPDTGSWGSRSVVFNGATNPVVLVRDTNIGGGDSTGVEKYYLYEGVRNGAGYPTSWTLRQTIAIPAGTYRASIASYPDNSIGMIHQSNDKRTIRFIKFTVSGSTYTAGSWETVATAVNPTNFESVDLDIADNGQPYVVATHPSSDGNTYILGWAKAATGGAWVQNFSQIHGLNSSTKTAMHSVSVVCLGTSATDRRHVVICGATGRAGADDGISLWTHKYTQATGATVAGEQIMRINHSHIGDIGAAVTNYQMERLVRLFRTDVAANEWTLGIMQGLPPVAYVWRGTWDGTGFAFALQGESGGRSTAVGSPLDRGFDISYAGTGEVLNFMSVYSGEIGINTSYWISNMLAGDIGGDTINWHNHAYGRWENQPSGWSSYLIMGGANRQASTQPHMDTLLFERNFMTGQHRAVWVGSFEEFNVTGEKPTGLVSSSKPALRVRARNLNQQYPKSPIKPLWTFRNLDTEDLSVYESPDTDYKFTPNTNVSGADVVWDQTLLDSFIELAPGPYDADVAMETYFGFYTSTYHMAATVSHPPTVVQVGPNSAAGYSASVGVEFRWQFQDTYEYDYQTAYQIIVERVDTSAVVHDTGKIALSDPETTEFSTRITLSGSLVDVNLRWKIRTWDSFDSIGSYSSYMTFTMGAAPIVSITSPTNGGTVNTGIPTIVFQADTGNARRIKAHRVSIFKGGVLAWDNGRRIVDVAENTGMTVTASTPVLLNATTYTVYVEVEDSLGIKGTGQSSFTTSFTPAVNPSGMAASITQYNVEGQGYVSLTWNDTGRESTFYSWVVYRKDDLIIPGTTTVVEAGTYKEVYRKFEIGTSYEFRDHFAPSGYKVNYLVKQAVNRFGDIVESANTTPVEVYPYSDGYWLIEGVSGAGDAFRLSIVTADDYDEEYEETDYRIIGRGRHFDQGEYYGKAGTLEAQIRDTGNLTARQKKLRLEEIKSEARTLWMRNPFGDIFRCAVKTMSISRIAGVGGSEFVDVTIPYVEVSE
jgi:hypothetical protein